MENNVTRDYVNFWAQGHCICAHKDEGFWSILLSRNYMVMGAFLSVLLAREHLSGMMLLVT